VPAVVGYRDRREGGAMPLLDDTAIEEGLQLLPGWERRSNEIVKTFVRNDFANAMTFVNEIVKTFVRNDFANAMTFVNEIAGAAETAGHHPDIDIRWNKVTLALSSHAEGGLTESDFQLAARIEELNQPTQPA
jgi:4a-hydroxytetrahydrobiopterin dehydratase